MESLTVGTFVGAGSFRCSSCGYMLALTGLDTLTACPSCGGEEFARASLFNTERIIGEDAPAARSASLAEADDWEGTLSRAREQITRPGQLVGDVGYMAIRKALKARSFRRTGIAIPERFRGSTKRIWRTGSSS